MKLTLEQKKQKNVLIKKAKEFKDKNKLISAIDFLIEKEIDPFFIDIKKSFYFMNKKRDIDLIVYKDNISKNIEDIIMIVDINNLISHEETIVNVSQNLFKDFKELFFILFFNNKKSCLTFKRKYEDKILINFTDEIPNFNWN